ncbi:MAG: hypothetical protein WHT82_04925, partial [Limisphaera sp.]
MKAFRRPARFISTPDGARYRAVSGLCQVLVLLVCGGSEVRLAAAPASAAWYETGFEEAEPAAGWEGPLAWAPGYQGGRALTLQRAAGTAGGSTVVRRSLPVESARGCLIRGTARVRAEGITPKPRPWNGIKFMLAVETPQRRLWPQAEIESGSFDWQRVAFTARIPSDATAVRLVLGLEEVAGQVWFDDVRLTIAAPPRPAP